ELNMELLKLTMTWLGIQIPIVRESELQIGGQSTERLVNICKAVNADTYVSGIGGKNYIQDEIFEKSGIRLEYQNYVPRPYPQRFTDEFVPNLSIIDMLANVGQESAGVIRGIADPPVTLKA